MNTRTTTLASTTNHRSPRVGGPYTPIRPKGERRYHIQNKNTGYILAESDDLYFIKNTWRKIPRRKHCTLVLLDTQTGEVMKTRYSKDQIDRMAEEAEKHAY